MTTETVPDPVGVQKPTGMSETSERSIDGEWTRSDMRDQLPVDDPDPMVAQLPRSALIIFGVSDA
jgi:hypothetical protein